jgi:hypothetical protein
MRSVPALCASPAAPRLRLNNGSKRPADGSKRVIAETKRPIVGIKTPADGSKRRIAEAKRPGDEEKRLGDGEKSSEDEENSIDGEAKSFAVEVKRPGNEGICPSSMFCLLTFPSQNK